MLITYRDRVLSKNELLDLIWPSLVLEENNLQVHVSALHKLLGPQTIATIPGRGYRFTATLAASGPATIVTTNEPSPAPPSASSIQPGATRIDGAADFHTVQMGRRRDVADAAFLAPLVVSARHAPGAAGYADAEALGRAWSYEDVVETMQQWLHQNAIQTDAIKVN